MRKGVRIDVALPPYALRITPQVPFTHQHFNHLRQTGVRGDNGIADFEDGEKVVLFGDELLFGPSADADIVSLVGHPHARKKLFRFSTWPSEAAGVYYYGWLPHLN